jgi:hypothetical protein
MDKRFDIRIASAFVNANNDIEFYDSDEDHIQDTIEATPGSYKEHPADGVNALAYLNSSGQESTIARKIFVQLQSDGYRVENPEVRYSPNGSLTINPNATR